MAVTEKKTTKLNKVIMGGICGLLVCGGCMMLAGCSSSIEIGGLSIGGSATATNSHKENYAVVQDVEGNEYATVIEMIPVGTTEIDPDAVLELLDTLGVNYYQAIISNNMGTLSQEDAYIYMPEEVTYNELVELAEQLASDGTYTCQVMTLSDYTAWQEETSAIIDVTRTELVYSGPAASSSSDTSNTVDSNETAGNETTE